MEVTLRAASRAAKPAYCRPHAGLAPILLVVQLVFASTVATAAPIVSLNVFVSARSGPTQSQGCGAANEPVCPAGGLQLSADGTSGGPDPASKSESSALASAHAGGADATAFYGLFASAFAQDGSSTGDFPASAEGAALATWIDLLTLSAPGIAAGTTGVLHGVLLLDGSQTGSVFDIDQGRSNVSAFESSLVLNLDMGLSHFFVERDMSQIWNGSLDVQEFGLHPGDPFEFAAQVVFGQPNSVRISTNLAANASADNNGSAFGSADFSSTVYWGGIDGLTLLDGTPVTNFTLVTTSGFDYTVGHQVEGPPPGVPEPSALALLLIGGAGLVRLASRRRRPGR